MVLVRETKRDDYREGLTTAKLEQWISKFSNDPEVKKLAENIRELHKAVFTAGKIDHIAFDLPEKLDKVMYIKIYRKIWATIRHDLWVSIQEEKKKENTEHLSPEKFSKLYSEVHNTFETVRMEIYSMMMNETVERHEARELMQKAYITFATLSATSDNKSRWADQVNEAAM